MMFNLTLGYIFMYQQNLSDGPNYGFFWKLKKLPYNTSGFLVKKLMSHFHVSFLFSFLFLSLTEQIRIFRTLALSKLSARLRSP